MKVSLLQNNIWQMQPRGRWQEISAPFRWVLRSAFPCQEAESLMQKNPAMPRETLGEFSKHNCMLFFNEPVFQAYFHAKTRPALIGFQGYATDLPGRALEWHSRGQRFDPAYLHQKGSHPKGWLLSLSKKSKSPLRRFCLPIVFGRFLCENGQKHHDPPRFFAKNAANSGPQAGTKLAKKPSAAGFSPA